jgi:hypothetical protein
MLHVRDLGLVLAAIAGLAAAAPAGATPRAALPAKAAPIVLVNDKSPSRGGPGFSPGDAVAIGNAIGNLLGAMSQPAPQPAPPPAYYPPPAYQSQPAYNPPPPSTYPPPLPPSYSAAPSVSDTPIPNPSPASLGAALGAGTGPAYQAAQQQLPALANATLNATVAATPPPDLTVQQIVEANQAAGDTTKAVDTAVKALWPPEGATKPFRSIDSYLIDQHSLDQQLKWEDDQRKLEDLQRANQKATSDRNDQAEVDEFFDKLLKSK